jgi:hypothetical protein
MDKDEIMFHKDLIVYQFFILTILNDLIHINTFDSRR